MTWEPVTPELRQLRYFVAAAEEGSLTRAAARLHLAQQSLSQQIRALERQIGAALLVRSSQGVTPTAAGTALLRESRVLLTQAERAIEAARLAARSDRSPLRVGFLVTVANYLMPPVVRTVRERHPHIAVRAEDLPIAALVAGVREGRLDAALTRPPLVDDLESEVVLREPVAAVLPVGHRLAGRDEVRMADLADEPWVLTPSSSWPPWHRMYENDFRRAGFSPRIVERGTSPQGLLALVAAGVGVTRLPCSSRSLRDSGVVFVPLAGEETEVVLVRRAGAPPPPAFDALRQVVHDVARTTDLAATG